MRALLLFIAVGASILLSTGNVLARTAACPCNPCPCAPCTCGEGKGGSSKPPTRKSEPGHTEQPKSAGPKTESGKSEPTKDHAGHHEAKKERGHSHGGGGVGVGISVDLSGIGQRRSEPDPFAAPGGPPRMSEHREENPVPVKKTQQVPKTDPFAYVSLTGPQAKEENSPPGPINVGNNELNPPQPGIAATPAPQTPLAGPPKSTGRTIAKDTSPDCVDRYKRITDLLAEYQTLFEQLEKADGDAEQLEGEAWDANNKLSEGYEDQSLSLIGEGRDQWKQIDKEWGPTMRKYETAFDRATRAHDTLVGERSAFEKNCPGYARIPEVPERPEKRHLEEPEPFGE